MIFFLLLFFFLFKDPRMHYRHREKCALKMGIFFGGLDKFFGDERSNVPKCPTHAHVNHTEYALTEKEALSDSDERTAVKVQYLHGK